MVDVEPASFDVEDGTTVQFMFNPETLTLKLGTEWDGGEKDEPPPPLGQRRFKSVTVGTMSFDLIFDTTRDGTSVTTHTSELMKLVQPNDDLPGSDTNSDNVRPPTVVFNWGQLHSWPAVVKSLDVTFLYFSHEGIPLRAKVSVTIEQFSTEDKFEKQNPTSGTPDPHRVHRVLPGETLDRIAARYYGDATQWRQLAGANGVEDPLALRPGALLTVPRLASS